MKIRTRYFLPGISLTILMAAPAAVSAGQSLDTLMSAVPFAGKGQVASGQLFKPEIKGNSIVSGNKILQIRSTGHIDLSTGVRNVINISPGFKTTCGWLGVGRHDKAVISRDKSDNSLSLDVKLLKTKSDKRIEVTYQVRSKLRQDGLIQLDFTWDIPAAELKNFKKGSIYIKWRDSQAGEKLVYKGKQYNIDSQASLGSKYPWILHAKGNSMIDLFPGNPAKNFKIIPEKTGSILIQSEVDHTGKQCMRICLSPQKDANQLSFLLDLRSGIVTKSSAYAFGGIDFMAVDALEIPDFSSSRNLIKNPSFEQGFRNLYALPFNPRRYFPGKKYLSRKDFEISDAETVFGQHSLKINTWTRGSWRKKGDESFPAHLTYSVIPVNPGTYTLSFYAKGNRPDRQVVSVGNARVKVTDKWKRYVSTYKITEKKPLSLAVRATSQTKDGSVWIDGIQLEKGNKATEFAISPVYGILKTRAPGNFIRYGDNINAEIQLSTLPGKSGTVRVRVKDFFSNKLFDQQFKFISGKDGKVTVKLPFEQQFQRGIFVLRADYKLDSGEKSYELFRFSIMDFLQNKHRLKNIFNISYMSPEQVPGKEKRLARWRQIGIGSNSAWTTWRKDSYDLMRKYGIDTMDVRMCNSTPNEQKYRLPVGRMFAVNTPDPEINRWVLLEDFRLHDKNAKLTPEYLQKFKQAVEKNSREAPWVKIWAFTQEIGGGEKFGLDYDDYIKLQVAFNKAVRAGNPKSKITESAPCNMRSQGGIKELDELLTKLNGKIKFDVISIHCYRKRPEETDLDSDFQALFKMLDRHGYKNTPVICDEGTQWGPYTIPQWNIKSAFWTPPHCWYHGTVSYDVGWSEKISAAWRARAWLVALKYQDRVKCLCQADFINNSELDLDLTPRVTQKIPNTLGRLFGDAAFKKDIRFAPYTRCYIFEDKQQRPVAAVWGYHIKLDEGVMKPLLASANFPSRPEVFDLMEAERDAKPDSSGNITFPVSSFPLFFRGKPGETAAFVKTFTNASLISAAGLAPVIVTGQPASPENILLKVNNLLTRPFKGGIRVNNAPEKPINIPSAEVAGITAPLPEKLSCRKITKEKIMVSVKDTAAGREFKTNGNFDGFYCVKAKKTIKIDGNCDDWREIPAVPLKNRVIRTKDKSIKISTKDFSGWFKVAWSENGLYLCVNITDDVYFHEENVGHHNQGDMHNRWNNDSFQVYFDTLCDARLHESKGYDTNDYDYAVFPNASGTRAVSYRYRTPDIQLTMGLAAPKDHTVANEIPAAIQRTENGYCYEVFFPKLYLLPFKPAKGTAIGFGLTVHDRDDKSGVKSSLTLPDDGRDCYNRPHTWPIMLLWD